MTRLICADVMEGLRSLEAESVQCVVTSPPYWGLRDYGTAQWEGGNAVCDHLMTVGGAGKSTLGAASGGHAISDERQRASQERQRTPYPHTCGKCGAIRQDQQLGLEPTPELYVEHMVEVFREIRRVLKRDGVLWLNLGDTYWASGGASTNLTGKQGTNVGSHSKPDRRNPRGPLKPKDRCMVPARVALALQDDGWWLRDEIVWRKPNPMPSSVTDRTTPAHEMIYLLTKAARYYYDADAIKTPFAASSVQRLSQPSIESQQGGARQDAYCDNGLNERTGSRRHNEVVKSLARKIGENEAVGVEPPEGANARSVWDIATEPFPDAHFATFPQELPRRCILAGSRPGDVVLDPFAGSGTTVLVARRHGRVGIGIELNPDYVRMAEKRLSDETPPLLSEATE